MEEYLNHLFHIHRVAGPVPSLPHALWFAIKEISPYLVIGAFVRDVMLDFLPEKWSGWICKNF